MVTSSAAPERPDEGSPVRGTRVDPVDLVALALLAVSAFVLRLAALPPDGLAHDDAWAALGGLKAPVSELLTVGSNHPGFTASLMAWDAVAPAGAASMTYPALLAGALGPPLLYAFLRWFRFARSVSVLLAAALVVADTHILYSGRVKTYVFDVIVVMALTVVVSRLSLLRWRWPTVGAWVLGALLVGSFSAFALLASAAGAIVLVLHPRGDRALRLVAAAAQGLAQIAYLLAVQRTYDASQLEDDWERLYDGYIEVGWNPIRVAGQIVEHLGRVADVYPGGPSWVTVAVGVVAVVGLVMVARHSVGGRYLAILITAAVVGSMAGRFPFGPGDGIGSASSVGGRATLWLIPVVAVGVAAVLHWIRTATAAPRSPSRTALDAIALVGAAMVLALGAGGMAPYPFSGSESATALVEEELGDDDVALVLPGGFHSFAVESQFDVDIVATPAELVGYVPEPTDPRIVLMPLNPSGLCERVRDVTAGHERVLVHQAISLFLAQQVAGLEEELVRAGYALEREVAFDDARVTVWAKDGGGEQQGGGGARC